LQNTSSLPLKQRLIRFFTGAGLPLFLASATLGYEIFLFAILLAPEGSGLWSAFSQQFKLWCFGYDPSTGGLEWTEVWVMQLEPIFVLGITIILFKKSILTLRKFSEWTRNWIPITSGLCLISLILSSLFLMSSPDAVDIDNLPFPGKRIRTTLTPPPLDLIDQKGNPFSLEELKGDVVIVTGIYTLCSNTCPLILVELSELLEELSPEDRKRTHVVAVTLNPENETPATMSNFVAAYGFEYPQFRYLNGDPTYVKELLKKLQLSRTVVPETGLIDHANLFIFIDAEGEIAYRLTLDDRHNTWLRAALKELTSETKSTNESLALNQDTL